MIYLLIGSHVRRIRVPSESSDVDQYLDDLFKPVLEWDSFKINEDSKGGKENDPPQDRKSSSSSRERSIISPGSTREDPNKLTGSIGKLKISSELRAKLELVTVAHAESSNRLTGEQQQTELIQNLIHRFTDQAEKVKPSCFI